MKRRKITVAVTGLNAIDNPGSGVSVIRSLRESDSFECRIVGLAYELLEPGIYMKEIVDCAYQVPYPSAGTEALFQRIEQICEEEKLDVIIPNFDAELYSYIKLERRLASLGVKVVLPTVQQFEERHKYNLSDFGKRSGILVPESVVCNSVGDFKDCPADKPIVVKGKFYDAFVVTGREQFEYHFSKIAAKWGVPVIVQQFVDGSEFNVAGLGDGNGNLLAAVPMSKRFITDKGKAWAGVTVGDRRLVELAGLFVKQTNWRGAFELELIKSKDGRFFLIEVNPRIPAWIYLATAAGQNIPEAVVRMALGENLCAFESYEVGKMFVRYSWDMIVEQDEFAKFSMEGRT